MDRLKARRDHDCVTTALDFIAAAKTQTASLLLSTAASVAMFRIQASHTSVYGKTYAKGYGTGVIRERQ